MKKLAIKGHPTRGKEVIELLEMLGGKNTEGYIGIDRDEFYTIEDGYIIQSYDWNDCLVLSLEEFLEKYPFKVGDKVEVCETNKVFTIGNMIWEDELCTVHYANMEDFEYYTAKELKPYKETNVKENTTFIEEDKTNIDDVIFSFNHTMRPKVNADGMLCYKIPDGYESFSIQEGMIILKPKKPAYPKTFEECLNMLYCKSVLRTIIGHKAELLFNLEKLLICRDAYWKIAGEEMGLGKPWDSTYGCEKWGYWIGYNINENKIYLQDSRILVNHTLVFPTEEMRNMFYENFKDLIEECKELL